MQKGGRARVRRRRAVLKALVALLVVASLALGWYQLQLRAAVVEQMVPGAAPKGDQDAAAAEDLEDRPADVGESERPQAAGGQEVDAAAPRRFPPSPPASAVSSGPTAPGSVPHAYLSIISNNKYVDGAMVLAFTLLKYSELWKAGQCHLVLLVPGGLADQNKARLRKAGWDRILDIEDDLAKYAPRSHLKDTFNKLYMFNLVQYHRVAYYDVDVLPLHNPDHIFSTKLPSDEYVGAIGTKGDLYFKTGMIVLQPSTVQFGKMLQWLKDGKYNHASGRDGSLLRDFFHGRFTPIDPAYSQYRRPWQDLKGAMVFHYRGEFKPWYDAALVPTNKWRDPERPPDLGPGYRLWWEEYHDMHFHLQPEEEPTGWGGVHQGARVTPKSHLWLMRYTAGEYIVPIWAPLKDMKVYYNRTTVGEKAYTCNTVCQDAHRQCVQQEKQKGHAGTEKATVCNAACQHFPDCHVHCRTRDGQRHCLPACQVTSEGRPPFLLYCDDRWPPLVHKKKAPPAA
eukprot:GGOE01019168.1.p1 GENE.GGOE01019168.1~~GGOE01019168.1.p1  ORF type:complete len:509 (-),score=139.83 GGOE01019168.1:160-1686(-)